MNKRISPAQITHLKPNEVFVFGDNRAALHGAGAARTALKWGAQHGKHGLVGQTYGIATKDENIKTLPVSEIKKHVDQFIAFTKTRPDLNFLVTPIGTGLAGFSAAQIAPLFTEAVELTNVYLPIEFHRILNDPFLDDDYAIYRLYKEYQKHKRLIVALDFDSTVYPFEKSYHKFPAVLDLVRRCQSLGFYIVIFTASTPDRFPMMIEYLAKHGIRVDKINENPIDLPYGKNGKIYYNILLDDRAGLSAAYDILNSVIQWIEEPTLDD